MKVDKDILHRYTLRECTEEEKTLVEAWFADTKNDRTFSDQELDLLVRALDKKIRKAPFNTIPVMKWITAVAAAVIALFMLIDFYGDKTMKSADTIADIRDIKAPVSSNAILVLENNTTYSLDSLRKGDTLRADGYLITKLATGELHYIPTSVGNTVAYNTLRTEKGGIAKVRLSDGTLVWLNANSELKYPIDFGESREVLLKGEAYFEVAARYSDGERLPFFVRGEQQTIKVLGTKFNADFTHKNEIALLEGKVALSNKGSQLEANVDNEYMVVMQPNQVYDGRGLFTTASIERYIDWKEGYFDLRQVSLHDLANELTNWYGVPVEIGEGLQNTELFGRVSRNKDLYEVLDIVSQAISIEYVLKNNKIFITKTNN